LKLTLTLGAAALFASTLAPIASHAEGHDKGQKDIFLRLRKAAEAPTFEGAKLLLDQIKAGEITDPDLASYYAFSKKCVDLCTDLGIPRDAYPGYLDIVAKLNYAAVLDQLTKGGVQNAPSKAARLVGDALKVKAQIPVIEDIDRKLAERYGLAPLEEALAVTTENCIGQLSWRTDGRTVDFDLKADGSFTAQDKPDTVNLSEGAGLVSEGKGRWRVQEGKLTITMTHVWVLAFWKEHQVIWIDDEKIVRLTNKRITLEDGDALKKR